MIKKLLTSCTALFFALSSWSFSENSIFLEQDSLELDKKALLDFIRSVDTEDNPYPFSPANWSEDNPLTEEWEGVTISDNRVTAIRLPAVLDVDLSDGNQSRILDGKIPESFKNLTALDTLILSDNYLRFIPDLSHLEYLDVRNNRLGFDAIVPNLPMGSGFKYVPQRRFGHTKYDTVSVGEPYLVTVDHEFVGTVYQWSFGKYLPGHDFNNNVDEISGANELNLVLDSVIYGEMGTYRLTMTHPDVPGLIIESRNINLVATTNVSGSVFFDDQIPIKGGEVIAYRITPSDPFISEDTAMISENGAFRFTDIGLGDFVFLAKPDREIYPLNQEAGGVLVMNTYAENTDIWIESNNNHIRQSETSLEINMMQIARAIALVSGGDVVGEMTVKEAYEFIDDPEDARTNARKKAVGVAVTLRRFTGISGRVLQDSIFQIYDYTETDMLGHFEFENVEEGIYKLHIDYPGVPMDADAEIDFEFGGEWENQLFVVESIIREDGISVESKEVISAIDQERDELLVYPNPTQGDVTLEFLVDQPFRELKLELIDFSGKHVMEKQLNSNAGINNIELDLTGYESGVYLMGISSKSGERLFLKKVFVY